MAVASEQLKSLDEQMREFFAANPLVDKASQAAVEQAAEDQADAQRTEERAKDAAYLTSSAKPVLDKIAEALKAKGVRTEVIIDDPAGKGDATDVRARIRIGFSPLSSSGTLYVDEVALAAERKKYESTSYMGLKLGERLLYPGSQDLERQVTSAVLLKLRAGRNMNSQPVEQKSPSFIPSSPAGAGFGRGR